LLAHSFKLSRPTSEWLHHRINDLAEFQFDTLLSEYTIAGHLGYDDLVNFAMENLLASPGATVLVDGQVAQIPTLVPNRRPDGVCRFLDPDNRCSIYAVSPYGCAFFDCHQSQREADIRSCRGLQAIAREWSVGGLYARIWVALHIAGFHAPSPTTARARLRAAIETRRSPLESLPSS
jgi:Fe-S-cluster containining protein